MCSSKLVQIKMQNNYHFFILFVIGLFMSIAPLYPCIIWAAGGHGTYLPLWLLYGPGGIFCPLIFCLYAIYIMVIRYDRRLIFAILFFHYVSVYSCIITFGKDAIAFDFLIEHLLHPAYKESTIMFILKWSPFAFFFIYNLCAFIIIMNIVYCFLFRQSNKHFTN